MRFLVALISFCFLASHAAAQSTQPTPTPLPAATPSPGKPPLEPVTGRDSKWRILANLGGGTLTQQGTGTSLLDRDYQAGSSAAFGILLNYRPNEIWGFDFGTKIVLLSRKAKSANLSLGVSYLALPFETRFRLAKIGQRSAFFVKAGLTYMVLLTASVSEPTSGGGDGDWDDFFPTPPTQGTYRESFSNSDFLISAGAGFDLLLFQVRDSFNMSLIPEIMLYRGLIAAGSSSEFGTEIHNQGLMISVSAAFGF